MNRDQFFAALRKAVPGIWNNPGAIKEGNELFDAFEARRRPDAPSQPEQKGEPHKIGPRGLKLVMEFEGCHRPIGGGKFIAYPDPGPTGLPVTIGWGTTRHDSKPIAHGTVWTQAQCDAAFEADLAKYAAEVADALGPSLARTSQAQFDALVSFHYNTGAIYRATLTARHRAGDYAGAAKEFARWNRAGGRVLAGLTRRRAAEAKLYSSGS